MLSANRGQLTLVIELPPVSICLFACFLFEADAQLRFVALARHPLFFILEAPFFGSLCVLFGRRPGRFLFLSLQCFGGDALALAGLALKLRFFLATNAVFLEPHELAKIEQK